MAQESIFTAVQQLAQISHNFSDVDMSQPFCWGKHDEGVRLGFLGTYHELCDLAAGLARQRSEQDGSPTLVQHVLGQYHTAYRELQAMLLGVDETQFDEEPAPGEWPLRITLGHIYEAERTFFTLIHYGLRQQQSGAERPFPFPPNAVENLLGDQEAFYDIIDNQPLTAVWQSYDAFHHQVLAELATIPDKQFLGPSPIWWEEEEYSLQYRLHRFEAHLRQHLIQIEKTLILLDRPPTEVQRLLQLIFRATAAVENAVLSAPELGVDKRAAAAKAIIERTAVIQQVVLDCHRLETAVNEEDIETIQQITAANPALVNSLGQNGLSLIMNALYQQKRNVVEALQSAGATLDVFAAAALGDLVRLQALTERWSGYLNQFAHDGFTPLQLACYFNQESAALWLIEQSTDVNAVAKNQMKIAPIHATATHGNLAILKALLEKGAEVNAAQAGGYTAIHQAAHRNNVPMAELLLKYGANSHQPDAKGQSAFQLAQAEGNDEVTAVLGR